MSASVRTPEERIYAKVTWRLLPFIGLCYFVAYLDRVNVSFARLQMQSDLSLSNLAYGFGAGIFFIGYFLFEVPSNLILHRVGARPWIARIMVSWGVVCGAMAFVQPLAHATGTSAEQVFYVMRFLLGVTEAGFFPGIILYFSYWYPPHRQSRAMALLYAAQPVAFILGGPLSGGIMDGLSGAQGLRGWQWMYLLEAVPALVLGVVVLAYLSDGIAGAAWLAPDEKDLLRARLSGPPKKNYPLARLLAVPTIWLFTAIYLLINVGVYGINFWLPSIVKAAGVTSFLTVGLITAVPYFLGACIMLIAIYHAERSNEKRWHAAIAAMLGGAGLILSTVFSGNLVLTILFITIANAGTLVAQALFWSFPASILSGAAAAAAIALINSLGNLGGFFGPNILGWFQDRLGSANDGLAVFGAMMILSGILIARYCRAYGLRQDGKAIP